MVFEDARRVEAVSAGQSGGGGGGHGAHDHRRSLCFCCGLFCTVILNHSKIMAEKGILGIPPCFHLNLTASLLLVFDLNFFLAG